MAKKKPTPKKKMYAINLRFGFDPSAQDWIAAIKMACQIEAKRRKLDETIPTNHFIRQVLLKNKDVQAAAKKLKVKLEHPQRPGAYARANKKKR